jgi:hypothetical protein
MVKSCLIVLQLSHLVLVTPGGKEFYVDHFRRFCRGTLAQQISNCERAQRAWERKHGESRPAQWAACASVR